MTRKPTATPEGFRRFLPAGDSGVFVNFADEPETAVATVKARRLAEMVRAGGWPFSEAVLDVIPGLNNAFIQYDPLKTSSSSITEALAPAIPGIEAGESEGRRHWIMPVLYGGEGGPDLEEAAERTGFTPEEVVERHLSRTLTVAIIGFMPGLGYLEGVDPALAMPRRSSPRQRVPALSLGIAMNQSVIYPLDSPGGWNLIGRVPVRIFEPRRDDPILFRPGDSVSFRKLDEAEFKDLDQRAAMGEAIIEPSAPGREGA